MKLSLLFTLSATEDKSEKSIEQLIHETSILINSIEKVYKDKCINVNRLVAGLHKNANLLHTHIAHIIEFDTKRVKNVQHWNPKLQGWFHPLINQLYKLRISHYTEDDAKYDEELGFSYCFKEYAEDDQIYLRNQFIGFSDSEIEELRSYGNNLYVKVQKEQERNEKRKQQDMDEYQQIFEYITKGLANTDLYEFSIKELYALVKQLILMFYALKYDNTGRCKFKAISIRDTAVSYMTSLTTKLQHRHGYLAELADFLN